jgi:hypothetical protein
MKKKYNELMKLYDELYQQTQNLSELLLLENNAHEIEAAVLNRGLLISLMDEIILTSTFSDEEKKSINSFVKKIKIIELKTMTLMEEKKDQLKKDIDQNRVNTRMASAYKLKRDQVPVIFDERE